MEKAASLWIVNNRFWTSNKLQSFWTNGAAGGKRKIGYINLAFIIF
jgi:hypothetical protein